MKRTRRRGVTIPELMIAIAVVAILAGIGIPSLREFILTQRVKAVNAQLVTDMQFARTEAVARNQWARVAFQANEDMTCYTIYTAPSPSDRTRCDCRLGAGSACSGGKVEIRTVQALASDQVAIRVFLEPGVDNGQTAFFFDHVTGRIAAIPTDLAPQLIRAFKIRTSIDSARTLQTEVGQVGRVRVCNVGSTDLGAPPCS